MVAVAGRCHAKHLVLTTICYAKTALCATAASDLFDVDAWIGLVAGAFISRGALATVFYSNAASFVIYLLLIRTIRFRPEVRGANARQPVLRDMREGITYIIRNRTIALTMTALFSVSLCIRPYVELLAAYSGAVLKGDANTLGMLMAANGVGAIVAALWLSQKPGDQKLLWIATMGGLIAGFAMLMFATSDNLTLCLICSALIGSGLLLNGIASLSLLQVMTDDHIRGRTMSLYNMLFRGGLALGALLIGSASDRMGPQVAFALASTVGIVTCGFIGVRAVDSRKSVGRDAL